MVRLSGLVKFCAFSSSSAFCMRSKPIALWRKALALILVSSTAIAQLDQSAFLRQLAPNFAEKIKKAPARSAGPGRDAGTRFCHRPSALGAGQERAGDDRLVGRGGLRCLQAGGSADRPARGRRARARRAGYCQPRRIGLSLLGVRAADRNCGGEPPASKALARPSLIFRSSTAGNSGRLIAFRSAQRRDRPRRCLCRHHIGPSSEVERGANELPLSLGLGQAAHAELSKPPESVLPNRSAVRAAICACGSPLAWPLT